MAKVSMLFHGQNSGEHRSSERFSLSAPLWGALVACVLLPLLIAVAWGGPYADSVYRDFQIARDIARGEPAGIPEGGFSFGHVLLLSLVARGGLPLPQVALVLSAFGWGIAVIAWSFVGLRLRSPLFALLAAGLLALHPLQGQLLGTEMGLVLALLGLAVAGALCGQYASMGAALLLSGFLQPVSLVLGLPVVLAGLHWRKSPPTLLSLVALSVSWGLLLTGGALLFPMVRGTRFLALLLLVVQLLAAFIAARFVPHLRGLLKPVLSSRALLRTSMLLGVGLLAFGQGAALVRAWQIRPVAQLALYTSLSAPLRELALPTEAVATHSPGLVGYLTERPTIALPKSQDAAVILEKLAAVRPEYCLALDSVDWDGVRAAPWFQEHYQSVVQQGDVYEATAPFELYRYEPSPFDEAARANVSARFEAGAGAVRLLRYRLSTPRIMPGEPVYLTLYWSGEGSPELLDLTLRLIDEETGQTWLDIENSQPGGLPMDLWGAEDEVADRYTLVLPEEAPQGRYCVEVSLQHSNGSLALFRTRDGLQGDVLALTNLLYPPVVSTLPPEPDVSIDMRLGDAISLVGYDGPARVAPGGTFHVAFYWKATAQPQVDYKVFVHLIGDDGTLLAQSDSQPANWSYPTSQWQAGEYIRDEHTLALDPARPRGDAWLSVGLYDPDTGERLVVRNEAGHVLAERRVLVQRVQVR